MLGPFIIDIESTKLSEEDIDVLSHPLIGGVILFSRNFESKNNLVDLIIKIKRIKDPSLIIFVDHEGGDVQRFKKEFTQLPPASILGKNYNFNTAKSIDMAYKFGWLSAYELTEIGIDVNNHPVLDIDYKTSDVMKNRCFADNLEAINKLTESYIKGSSNFGLSLICKHFPGHGYVKPDTHKSVAVDNRQIKTIFENDIQAFINAIENKIQGVMMSHVIYKKFDILPSSLSPKWNKFLREEIRFNGIVIADDLSMRGLDEYGDITEKVNLFIKSGIDCAFVCNDRNSVIKILDNMVCKPDKYLHEKLITLKLTKKEENQYDKFKRNDIIKEILDFNNLLQNEIDLKYD